MDRGITGKVRWAGDGRFAGNLWGRSEWVSAAYSGWHFWNMVMEDVYKDE